MKQYPSIDQVFDGVLVQSCDFCLADQLMPNHERECADMQLRWIEKYGELPEPTIPLTGLILVD